MRKNTHPVGRGKPRPIEVKNFYNGIHLSFVSIAEAAKYFDVNPGNISHALRPHRTVSEYLNFVFKYADDPRSFLEIRQNTKPRQAYRINPIAVKDLATGAVRTYRRIDQLLKAEGITKSEYRSIIKRTDVLPFKGRLFKRLGAGPLLFPNYPKHVLDLYQKYKFRGSYFYEVVDPEGNVSYWDSIGSWVGAVFTVSRQAVDHAIKRCGQYRGYRVVKYDMRKYGPTLEQDHAEDVAILPKRKEIAQVAGDLHQ